MARKKLGEMLLEAGVIDETGLRAALVEQRRWGGHLGRVLVDMKLVTEDQLVATLSRQLGIPTVDLSTVEVPQAVIELVPGELAEQFSLLPFAQPMKFLDVAMSDPTNLGIIDELRIRTQLNVRPYLAGPRTIERAVARYYGRGFALGGRAPAGIDLDVDSSRASRPMEVIRTGTTQPPPMGTPGAGDVRLPPAARAGGRDAEILALQERISKLEALVQRDEDVLRKLLGLLVEKGVATRDEILERIR